MSSVEELYKEYQEGMELYNRVRDERSFSELYDLVDSLLGEADILITKLLAERERAYQRQSYDDYIRG